MFTVRSATPADAAALALLSGELGYASTETQIGARLAYLSTDADHAVFVAVDETARVVGWVHVYRYLVLESDPRAEIGGLVTARAVRRHGVGRLLIARAETWAKMQGLSAIGLRCNALRTEAHAFYEKVGFERTKTQFSFRKTLH